MTEFSHAVEASFRVEPFPLIRRRLELNTSLCPQSPSALQSWSKIEAHTVSQLNAATPDNTLIPQPTTSASQHWDNLLSYSSFPLDKDIKAERQEFLAGGARMSSILYPEHKVGFSVSILFLSGKKGQIP